MSSDPIPQFFDDLSRRGQEPLLGNMTGVMRIELMNGSEDEVWRISVERGSVTVERGEGEAGCVLRTTREVFGRLVRCEQNAMAAVLRGAVGVAGSWELLARFQKLFPGPTGSDRPADRAEAASSA
jgi:SCP-2 sterol transfer family protein